MQQNANDIFQNYKFVEFQFCLHSSLPRDIKRAFANLVDRAKNIRYSSHSISGSAAKSIRRDGIVSYFFC